MANENTTIMEKKSSSVGADASSVGTPQHLSAKPNPDAECVGSYPTQKRRKPPVVYHNYPLLAQLLIGSLATAVATMTVTTLLCKYCYGWWAPWDALLANGARLVLLFAAISTVFWLFKWEYYYDY